MWKLDEGQGVCPWCGRQAHYETQRTNLRPLKSSRRRKQRQADGNGYDHLDGDWLAYYKAASRFAHKAQDTEDLLHDIILTLAVAERNNGHKPFTEAVMYRIASRATDKKNLTGKASSR